MWLGYMVYISSYETKNFKYLIEFLLFHSLIFFIVNMTYGNIPKYITTDYLYSDFFENVNKNDKCIQHYTEGDY